jgi:nitrite reductase/ring-hydroxylating ferredoxin subunit
MPPSETLALKSESDPGAAGFVAVAELDKLRARRVMVVKHGKKQIALFASGPEVYACNNRCPHEGYPLSEGSLSQGTGSQGCLLTCNWHNWKFDLDSGETLIGGDNLRRYPVRLADGKVWLDLGDPPAEARAAAALVGLRAAFERHDRFREYEHMARELARYMKAGGEPFEALRQAIHWAHDRLEYGTSHAVPAAADWLSFRAWQAQDGAGDDSVANLAILTEAIGHFAWDCLRQPSYPYPEGRADYRPGALVAAIEAEDEAAAVAQVRGALAAGLGFAEMEAPLAEAALAHYADFGHSAIYVVKTGQLIERLGPTVAEPLLLALVRALTYAFREDLIPEFRAYGPALAAWPAAPAPSATPPGPEDFIGLATPAALARAGDFAADPRALHRALLGASAWQMLHFDADAQARNDRPVQDNVGWLDFTHALTFGNAVREICARQPRLWPRGLLQMACFLGRNTGHVDRDLEVAVWRVDDGAEFLEAAAARLLDHGQPEYILSGHLLKTFMAVRAETAQLSGARSEGTGPRADLLAALNRLLNTPIKRKFTLRSARQSLDFVARED